MCCEALKSKLLFRRDAHELHAEDAAEDIEIDDPKTGRKPREICKASGAGFYAAPGTDLRDSHIPAAHHERKQHWKSSDRAVSKQIKNAVGIGVCPAAAKAAAIGAGGVVSPLHGLAAAGKSILRLLSADGRHLPEIRRIS